jgi:hypothetical protein
MANPYVVVEGQLNIVSGARSPVVLKDLKPPTPPIRQMPLPTVLYPFLKRGG